MRILGLSVTIACLTALAAAAQDAKLADPTPEGTWKPVTAELNGEAFPDDLIRAMKLVIAKGKYTLTLDTQVDEGTCTNDPKKSPRTLDIKGTKGPNEGRTILAIYEIKGDEMRVCYDMSGKARPTEFSAKKGSGQFLVTYRREKS